VTDDGTKPPGALYNLRTGAVLARQVERAVTMAARLRGLLGRSGLPDGEALAIEPCTSLHTFFMRFPIDALFLSREGRVIRAISDLRPWRATRIYPRATLAVELPAGTIARTGTREGDTLVIQASRRTPGAAS
jgi:uncharacterized membrane protein (UPF0127 family)